MSESYRKYRAAGICYICRTTPTWGTHCTCDACARVQREKQQARVARARADARCVKCFHEPQAEGSRSCARCRERAALLHNTGTREAEVTQRPLRKWRKKHAGAGVASRRDPKQGHLL
jgi:hypothetical protein